MKRFQILVLSILYVLPLTPDVAYVTNNSDNTIRSVDLSIPDNPMLGGSLGGFANPIDIAIHPNGHYAYVTPQTGTRLQAVDLSNPTVPQPANTTAPVFTAPTGLVLLPSGNYAYVTNNATGVGNS